MARPPAPPSGLLRPLAALAVGATLAIVALFRERLPRGLRERSRAAVGAFYKPLRRIHNGHVADYVT